MPHLAKPDVDSCASSFWPPRQWELLSHHRPARNLGAPPHQDILTSIFQAQVLQTDLL